MWTGEIIIKGGCRIELRHAKCLEQCLAPRKGNVNVSRYYIIVISISGSLTVIGTASCHRRAPAMFMVWFGMDGILVIYRCITNPSKFSSLKQA